MCHASGPPRLTNQAPRPFSVTSTAGNGSRDVFCPRIN
jgi:hypothetical protein